MPPLTDGNQPAFYPFWTIGRSPFFGCAWNFGNVIPGRTVKNFNFDSEYGTADTARYGGTLTSPVLPNPMNSTTC